MAIKMTYGSPKLKVVSPIFSFHPVGPIKDCSTLFLTKLSLGIYARRVLLLCPLGAFGRAKESTPPAVRHESARLQGSRR